ncbi:hypothetical protein N9J72_02675, partial [Candidatus Gracilibacteria bacterium]|nr:hypothetical protein [Candidatus Gracilibacteria bacterium]
MQEYIEDNTNNVDVLHTTPNVAENGYLYLDLNASHIITLFEISKNDYSQTRELRVTSQLQSEEQGANLGYLQTDMTLASGTGSAYTFDFLTHDYALFVENTSDRALLYQVTGEDALTGSGLYLN